MRRNATRAGKRHSYRQEHDEIGDSITDVQQELATTTQQQKALAAKLKELKSQKKELGRVPRNSTSGRTAQSTSSIPQLVGNADADSGKRLMIRFINFGLTLCNRLRC